MSVFGEFKHHFPYFGKLGKKDAIEWQKATLETHDLNEQLFGESVHNLAKLFDDSSDTVGSICTPKPSLDCYCIYGDAAKILQLRPSLPNNALNVSHAWY